MTPYYERGDVTIYNCDCRELLPQLEPVDLVLTDPPYGVEFKGKNTKHTKRTSDTYATIADDADSMLPMALEVLASCRSVATRVVLTPGVKNMFAYPKPDHTGAFYYPSGAGMNSWGFTCWQPILYYGTDPYGGKGSRPDSKMSTEASEPNGHPCPKPIGAWRWLLDRTSEVNHSVVDPFTGSGTTGVACVQLGRKFIGIEISEKYCEIAAQRIDTELNKGRLFAPSELEPPTQLTLTTEPTPKS